ncbi:hypothetical protein [Streptomyces lydicus]|uniref:hypothetical protein n=1 Tax=Streptomyces lydicus TaxID=47763 RepID=UPI00378BD056
MSPADRTSVCGPRCSWRAALHRYLTRRLGGLRAIHTLETAPVLRTVKGAGPLAPAAAPRPSPRAARR